jgi:uncharacterized protein
MTTLKNSALYVGTIRHRRFFPTPHGFNYPIFMSFLDLDELDAAFAGRWFFSHRRRNLVEFRRSDFFAETGDLKQAVLDAVQQHSGERPSGRVCILTHLRHFGLSFNPVTFYYCYNADDSLHSIVAEITNTPWGERHSYVLVKSQADHHGSAWHFDFPKQFHVSPFLPMQMDYSWRFQTPAEHLRVHMDVFTAKTSKYAGQKQFDSTLVLGRKPWNAANLASALLRFPFITFGVMLKIYWNAALLKIKRNPFFDHPKLTDNGSS